MSKFFKYVDQCPNVAGSLPDKIMEGDSRDGLEFEALLISDKSKEITNAPIEIITVSSSEDKPENAEVCIHALAVAEVSESSGDEGGDDLDGAVDDLEEAVEGLDKGELEKRKSQLGDDRPVPEDIPVLEDAAAEEDEFTMMWRRLGLQPDKGQVNLVKENWRKIKGRIEVIWQDLRMVIIDAFRNHGRMVYSEEERHLKEELALVTNMSLIMEQRLELLQLLAMHTEFGTEY